MWAMNVKGGLVHGRDLTDSIMAQWILSGTRCLKLCGEALEQMSGVGTSP